MSGTMTLCETKAPSGMFRVTLLCGRFGDESIIGDYDYLNSTSNRKRGKEND